MNHFRRILRYIRPYRGVFALAIVGMVIVASTDVMMLRIVQPLLNNMGSVGPESTWWLPFALVGVFVLRGVGSYVSDYGLAWIGSRVVFDLRCEASEHLLRLPTPYYDATSAGFLLSKITFDAQQIAATASEAAHGGDPQHADDPVRSSVLCRRSRSATHSAVRRERGARGVAGGEHIC